MVTRLSELKRDGNIVRQRSDMLWYLLLQSAATQGNSRGWQGLFGNPQILETVAFEALGALAQERREAQILAALRSAKIRMQTIKAPRLAANFERILQMGGVETATRHMLNLPTRDEKFAFICSFAGIGEKYGRNIWMDIYDPAFRNTVAVDERIKKVANALGSGSRRYRDVEAFFCAVAADCDMEPWEVDRLLYNFTDHFLNAIGNAT